MTLQEAILSRLPFRRPDSQSWLCVTDGGYIVPQDTECPYCFTVDQLLSQDWVTYDESQQIVGRIDALEAKYSELLKSYEKVTGIKLTGPS